MEDRGVRQAARTEEARGPCPEPGPDEGPVNERLVAGSATARTRDVPLLPPPSREPTIHRRNRWGQVHCHMGGSGGDGPRRPRLERQWEEFGEAMEKDFRAVPKRFWKTIRHLRRGKRGTIQTVYSKDETLLTWTEEAIGRWKGYSSDLLNCTQPRSVAETELKDARVSLPISLDEVTKVVKQLHSGKAPGVDEIPPEMLKALGVEGRSPGVEGLQVGDLKIASLLF